MEMEEEVEREGEMEWMEERKESRKSGRRPLFILEGDRDAFRHGTGAVSRLRDCVSRLSTREEGRCHDRQVVKA